MISIFKNNTSEQEIISGLQAAGIQRRVAERKLFELFFYFIKQGTLKYALAEEDVASVYSDTIISVINNIVTNKFEGRSSLKSYAYQVFSNKCVDALRKETTNKNKANNATGIDELLVVLPDTTKNVLQQLIEKNQLAELKQKLEEIGEKCKQLLLLYEDGYSDKQIAGVMSYNSADVVKTSRLRCLEKLKEKMLSYKNQHERNT